MRDAPSAACSTALFIARAARQAGLSQSFPTLGLRANCALPNLPRLNQRYGFDRLRTSTYNQKLDRAAFSRRSPTGWKKFATGPVCAPRANGADLVVGLFDERVAFSPDAASALRRR